MHDSDHEKNPVTFNMVKFIQHLQNESVVQCQHQATSHHINGI